MQPLAPPAPLPGRARAWLVGAAIAVFVAAPRPAWAEPPPPDEDADSGTKRAPAPDTRTGHLFLDGSVSVTGPAGSFMETVPTSSLVSTGLTVGGIIGVGITRHTVLEARGNYTFYSQPQQHCISKKCEGKGFDLGIGLSYHLAQGIAFDPWASYGMAIRSSSFLAPYLSTEVLKQQSYVGLDVARLAIGGDFYPIPQLGFGPYLELDLGTNFSRPATPVEKQLGGATYAFFSLGFRIALDPIRRAQKAQKPPEAAGAAARIPGI